jgi:hypothetical protein
MLRHILLACLTIIAVRASQPDTPGLMVSKVSKSPTMGDLQSDNFKAKDFTDANVWPNRVHFQYVVDRMLDQTLISGGWMQKEFGLLVPIPAQQKEMWKSMSDQHHTRTDWLWHAYWLTFYRGFE